MGMYCDAEQWAGDAFTVSLERNFNGLVVDAYPEKEVLFTWCTGDECVGLWSNTDRYTFRINTDHGVNEITGIVEHWMFSDPASAVAFKMRFA